MATTYLPPLRSRPGLHCCWRAVPGLRHPRPGGTPGPAAPWWAAIPGKWPWSGPWASFTAPPIVSGGTTPDGVDCSGLVQALYQRAGVNLPRTVAHQYQAGKPVARHELRFGDVVFFNRYCQTRGRGSILAGMFSSGAMTTRSATTAFTWAGAASCTLPPGACLSAAWTPRSGGSPTAGPGAISPAAIKPAWGEGEIKIT